MSEGIQAQTETMSIAVREATAGPGEAGVDGAPEDQGGHREIPTSSAFRQFIADGWADPAEASAGTADVARFARRRREVLSAKFWGERLVIPAGSLKVRSYDTHYGFRAHSAFAYLSGLGADAEPGSVLVLEPSGGGHRSTLYLRPRSPVDSEEFYSDAQYGEFWVGPRAGLDSVAARLDIETRSLDELRSTIATGDGRVVRDADDTTTRLVDAARGGSSAASCERDEELARAISAQRLVKDDWEIGQLRDAIEATSSGFEELARGLPEAVARRRGERWIEGLFGLHARHAGNGVGYESICAAGDHANTIHWTRNDGALVTGDLVLVDAGVEVDSLYTADVTRTLPIGGRYSLAQREVYDAVLAAQEAGLAAVRPGNRFRDVHQAAIQVIAQRLLEWGLLPDGVSLEDTLDPGSGGWHRRWMVHGTSHHLGLDVHDCGLLLREEYLDTELRPGMVLTVEPGLYFKADDLFAPQRFRGIGVRIEDDVLVTADGFENLTAGLPRTADDVEAWMVAIRQ